MVVEKDKSSKKKKSYGEKKEIAKELEISIETTMEESGEIVQKRKREREDPPLRYRETALIDGVMTPKETQKFSTCRPLWSQCTTPIRTPQQTERSSGKEQVVHARPLWSEIETPGVSRSYMERPPTEGRFWSDLETLDISSPSSGISYCTTTTAPESAFDNTSNDTTVPSDSSMFPCKDTLPTKPEAYYQGKEDTVFLKQGEKCYKSLDNRTLLFIREVPNNGQIVQEKRADPRARLLSMRRDESERVEEEKRTQRNENKERGQREKREQRNEENERGQREKREQRNEEIERQRRRIEKNTEERVQDKRREPINFGFDAAITIHDWKFPGKKHMFKLTAMCPDFKMDNAYINDEPVDIERKKRFP